MSPDQEHRIEEIFSATCALPPAERAAFVGGACGDDAELRRGVESLIEAHEQAGRFLQPAVGHSITGGPLEKPGDRIGRYKLLEQIGEGGFGVVWMAEQEEPVRRRVALKIIKLGMDTREVIARFEAERQALAMMDHPNIARVFDGGATGTGRPYFVMELVKGVPITNYCDSNKLATPARLRLFMQVCHAIQHAHQKGVIHRDLKPSNILVTVQDDRPVPKVIDFGVAKATQARLTEKTVFTRFRQWIGTPSYMSPEQAGLGSLDVDTRSDVYSLGVLLYELLTGRTPFDTRELLGAGYELVMRTIREEEPPKPSTRLSTLTEEELTTVAASRSMEAAKLGRLIRGDLDWIVMKALEKDRSRRYETASALAQDLEHFLVHEPVSAAAPALGYRLGKFTRRNRLVLSTVALFVLLVLAGATVSTWQAVRATRFAAKAGTQERLAMGEAARATKLAKEAGEQKLLAMSEAARATRLAAESENARRRADQEAATAAAVNEFLKQDLLARTVPRAEAEEKPEPELKVRTLLDRASEKIGGRFTNQPLVEASLRATIAGAYHDLGLYATQEVHARWAAEVYARELGETNEVALRMIAIWGDAERHLGRAAEAVQRLEHVRELEERVFGSAHTNTLQTMNLLGVAYAGADQGDRGRALLQEALRRAEQGSGKEGRVVCELLNNLSILLAQDRQFAAAEQIQRRHLALTRERVGTAHLETLGSLFHLATVLTFEQKLSEAETLFREAITISEQLGRKNEEDGTLLENLGIVLAGQKKLTEAEAAFRETLALRRTRRGPENAGVVHALTRLAGVLNDGGRYAEAEPLLREAMDILKRQPAIQDDESFKACARLMLGLDAQGRGAELESVLREVEALVKQRPASAPGVLLAKMLMSALLSKQGRLAEGEALLLGNWQAVVMMVFEEVQGPQFLPSKPPSAERTMQNLAVLIDAMSEHNREHPLLARAAIYGRLGRSKEAAEDLARCFAYDRNLLGLALVPLWMDSGNVSGYERYSRDLWDHYNRSPAHLRGPLIYVQGEGWVMKGRLEGDPATAAGVALALAIYPRAQSYKNTDTLAERAVERGANHPSLPRFQMVLALAEYRFGRFESSAEWARRSLAGTNVEPATVAMANAVLSMAKQRLHQTAQAEEALQRAQGLLRTNLPPVKDGTPDLGENWPDWLMAELLVKEATTPDLAVSQGSSDVVTNGAIGALRYSSVGVTMNLGTALNSPAVVFRSAPHGVMMDFGAALKPQEELPGTESVLREPKADITKEFLPIARPTGRVYFPATLAAIVNERAILASDVRKKAATEEQDPVQRQNATNQAMFEQRIRDRERDTLQRLIDDELIVAEAKAAGRQISKDHVESFIQQQIQNNYRGDSNIFLQVLNAKGMTVEEFREQHARDDLVAAARQQKLDAVPAPTEAQIEQYYHAHEKEFRVDESVKLSLIAIRKNGTNGLPGIEAQRKLAAEIRARAVEGADFANLARLYGQDPSARNGGERGWVERNVLRKELADVAFSLQPGGMSDLIETEQSWYVMRVADRRPATVKGMADVHADIHKILEQQERSAVVNQWLGRLRAQAFIRHLDAGSAIARVAEKVVTIEIKHIGVVTVGDAAIRPHLQVREGELVTQASVDHDLRSLYETGNFFNIRVMAQTVAGGMKLVYYVQENPVLTDIQFTGSNTISRRKLFDSLESKTSNRMEECKLFSDAKKIERLYQGAGYPSVTVKYRFNIEETSDRARVTFEITEGGEAGSEGVREEPSGAVKR